ncbi:hypothetical protein AB0I60_27045 [Actinosynnema sp. NPDC050436]
MRKRESQRLHHSAAIAALCPSFEWCHAASNRCEWALTGADSPP